MEQQRRSEVRLHRVVPRSVPNVIGARFGGAGDGDMDAAELGVREALRWVVGQQILSTKFVADLAECVVELRHGGGVVVFASRIFGKLNEGILSAGFASGTAFDGHNDDA